MGAAKFLQTNNITMRIIGEIAHPTLKISVFKNDNRTSVKFENGVSEISFKMGDDDRFRTSLDIEKLLDPIFLEDINRQFQAMHTARLAAMSRLFPVQHDAEFETIL